MSDKKDWREWASVRGDEDEFLSDLYERPIATLTDLTMANCGQREWVPGTWSDWWQHLALVLAMMHEMRGGDRSVKEWLDRMVSGGLPSDVDHLRRHRLARPIGDEEGQA